MKQYRIRGMTKRIIITMPSCDKLVIENQEEINQYHKNLLKDQKKCHTLYFVHQTINIDDYININHKSQ